MAKEILIADSDKSDQEEFKKIFETTDYHLIFSEDGEDALLRARLLKPDLIIAEMSLKETDGLELCKTIKTDPECKSVPFLLLLNIFDELSEDDRKRAGVDGVISKPFFEDEVLNLVDQLVDEEAMKAREEAVFEKETEWKSMDDSGEVMAGKRGEFSLDELGEMEEEEEIIELVEVVEEPEQKMSINDFVGTAKEEPLGEITSLESWKEMEREERVFEEAPPQKEEPAEKYSGLEEFETALRQGVKAESLEADLQPFFMEEPKEDLSEEVSLEEIPVEEELKELSEEEFPKELQELLEELGEEEIEVVEEPREALAEEEIEALKGLREVLAEEVEPREIRPEEISFEEVETVEVKPEKISFEERVIEKPPEAEIPWAPEEKAPSLMGAFDRQLEEVISKGVREMMEKLMTQLVPEMTRNIIGLTLERIERMVREIVPDLAEKAIQEEIRRLHKGEKG